MPVPFEALIPYGIIIACFGATGVGLGYVRKAQAGGMGPRWGVSQWDKQMMERDLRITGSLRGQSDDPNPPLGFELNNPWKIEKARY